MVVGDFPIERDTIVIGAGPGGYVAAIRASQLGQKVTIIEKQQTLGGVCLNVGCIPSKAMIHASHLYQDMQNASELGITASDIKVDWSKVQAYRAGVVNKLTSGISALMKGNNIEVVHGEAFFVDDHTLRVINENSAQTYKFNNAIIATGSSPIELPNFKFSKRVLDSTRLLELEELPESLVVIGGGVIGVELGTVYANFGTKVTILEGTKELFAGSYEKAMTALVKRNLKKKGAEVITNAMAQGVEEKEDGVVVTYEHKGETKTVEADYVAVVVGRRPNTAEIGLEQAGVKVNERGLIEVDKQCRTNVPNIYAIGDIVPGPQLAHKASYEAKIAAAAISGLKDEIDYLGIPAVVYGEPELASVGYTEKQAKEEGIEVEVGQFPYAANGRSLGMNNAEGFFKLVARKEDGVIIGGQIAGPNASDLIAEVGVAIECGLTAEDIALTIHAHPTFSEMAAQAAEIILGMPTDTIVKKK